MKPESLKLLKQRRRIARLLNCPWMISKTTKGEKLAISSFLKADDLNATPSVSTTELSLMDRINARKKLCMTTTSKYCNLDWIPATSDIVERFFSQAKLVLTDLRKSMSPFTLESILFLKVHKDIWANPDFVKNALRNNPEASDDDEGDEDDDF